MFSNGRQGTLLEFGGARPRVAADAFLAPTALLIGDVEVATESSVWFHCVLRGDQALVRVGPRTNVQDGSVLHGEVVLEEDVTVGHNAIVHGCSIGRLSLIGMGAVVMDGALVGTEAIVAPGSVVTPASEVPDGVVVSGNPARILREVRDGDRDRMRITSSSYVHLAAVHRGKEELDPGRWSGLPAGPARRVVERTT